MINSWLPLCATILAMGTWDDGLYDNDSALDTLADLVRLDRAEQDVARLVARVGLLAWMNPATAPDDWEDLQHRIAGCTADLERLPAETRSTLRSLLADPMAASRSGSRTQEVRAVLGGYRNGQRLDALLRFPGAEAAINDLVERAVQLLDNALHGPRDLYQVAGDLAALGVLIELQQAGLWTPKPAQLAAWYDAFVASDRATKSERGFWWKYSYRVRRGFVLLGLAAADSGGASASARPRRAAPRPAPAGPCERFLHPTFGAATLVARSGAGDQETLELRFADGAVRKIRKKFVTAIVD